MDSGFGVKPHEKSYNVNSSSLMYILYEVGRLMQNLG
jgi:hypothetical protein